MAGLSEVRREGNPQRSRGGPDPPALRTQVLDWYAARAGGMLVRVGARRTRRDFSSVTVQATGESLSPLGLSGLLLADRLSAVVLSNEAVVEVAPSERVEVIRTCADLYRTQMGKGALLGRARTTDPRLAERDGRRAIPPRQCCPSRPIERLSTGPCGSLRREMTHVSTEMGSQSNGYEALWSPERSVVDDRPYARDRS